jgi:hypothetical protein
MVSSGQLFAELRERRQRRLLSAHRTTNHHPEQNGNGCPRVCGNQPTSQS